ncbi:hypothetical protein WMZ97_14945 [Lentibacillus sp. N15]|uniref:hypothetical protein n=1 Tax=Lentibacillus songyuanensis TaxID=3136161 RepID=UPI0031BB8325
MDAILIILAIIGGIIGLFNKKSEQQTNQKPYKPKPARSTPTIPNRSQQRQTEAPQKGMDTIAMQEQRDAQMHELASRMKLDAGDSENEDMYQVNFEHLQTKPSQFNENKTAMKNQVRKNLNRKGLVDGIVMAEVLGPPRARKPYRSITSQRKE